MRKNDFHELAREKGHSVVYFHLPLTKSLSIPCGKQGYIGLSPCLTDTEETTCLAHELGHCEYGGFYCRDSPLDLVERHEYRANVWAVLRAVPFPQLRDAIRHGITKPWELADHFGITEEFLHLAVCYYTERRGFKL